MKIFFFNFLNNWISSTPDAEWDLLASSTINDEKPNATSMCTWPINMDPIEIRGGEMGIKNMKYMQKPARNNFNAIVSPCYFTS
jgi:hypothetical protein